jgi:uncharacterized protein YdcH (DUF465 family)
MEDKFEKDNSLYPTLDYLVDNQLVEVDQEIYRLNRTNEIIKELKKEEKHYQSIYKKYKKLHKTMYASQLLCNSVSVASGACTAGTLVTGVAVIAAIPIGLLGMITGGFGILFGTFDQKTLKKMKKHSKIVQLCQSLDSEILRKYLNDQHITKEEFSEILNMMEKYYTCKEELRSKSRLIGNIENLKTEFIEQGKKLAFLEAVSHSNTKNMLKSQN